MMSVSSPESVFLDIPGVQILAEMQIMYRSDVVTIENELRCLKLGLEVQYEWLVAELP